MGHRCIFSEITVDDRFRHNVGALNNSQAGSLPYVDSDPVPVGEGEVGALNEALGREFSPMLRETQCECRNPKDNEVDLLTFSHLKKNKYRGGFLLYGASSDVQICGCPGQLI